METCLAGADDWRGGNGAAVLERGPAEESPLRCVLRGRSAGGLPPHGETSTVTVRRGVLPLRPQRAGSSAVRSAGVPASGRGRKNRESKILARHEGGLQRQAGDPGVKTTLRGGRMHRHAGREVILCGGAINSPQLLQLSGVGSNDELRRKQHRRRTTTHLGSTRTFRTISKSTSSTPPSCRSRSRPGCGGGHDRRSASTGCSSARGSARPTTSRQRLLSRQ